jgi:hypothetical protein
MLNGWTHFSYVLRPADVTIKEVNHIRCFAIDIAKDVILLSCRLAMENLCALQLETALATLATKQRLGDLRHQLKRRGYNNIVRESGFSQASEINRNDLLEYKEKKVNKRVLLVPTYHPSLEKISGIVRH